VVNQLDDSARETFPTGRPLEDTPELQQCKICKKSILKTAVVAHVEACVKAKNEKLKKKKEQKEAREREKKLAAKGDEKDKDEDGDTRMDDDDEDEDVAADKKGPGGLKSAKKSAGKKIDVDDTKKGKKRKADGDAEKGPKQKKKKEEPKPKAPKQKGMVDFPQSAMFLALVPSLKYCRLMAVMVLSISLSFLSQRVLFDPYQPFFHHTQQTNTLAGAMAYKPCRKAPAAPYKPCRKALATDSKPIRPPSGMQQELSQPFAAEGTASSGDAVKYPSAVLDLKNESFGRPLAPGPSFARFDFFRDFPGLLLTGL
jgi:hypothetical protein